MPARDERRLGMDVGFARALVAERERAPFADMLMFSLAFEPLKAKRSTSARSGISMPS